MFLRSDWHTERKYIKLQRVIDKWIEHPSELAAKENLLNFFEALRHCRPDKKLNLGFRTGYYSFLINLLPLQNALVKKKYALACHELETLFACEPILQKRIYCNLWQLYEKYLE